MKLSPQTRAALARPFAVWAPPRREPPSEWMKREYVIAAEESASPGKYSFAHYAFLREIFDSFVDLEEVLARGLADFGAYRTDVIFICMLTGMLHAASLAGGSWTWLQL